MLPLAREHGETLRTQLKPWTEVEDDLFHCDVNDGLLARYKAFVRDLPQYPGVLGSGAWQPSIEVERRKSDPTLYPYCLFTAYFANVYFGVRQAIEIDSLRYAAEQLSERVERDWVLGALVVAASSQATTYASHFAQPAVGVRDLDGLSLNRLSQILEKRSRSIYHEFSVRLLNLSHQSERLPRSIESVAGPWQNALESFARCRPKGPVAVYLDAPYTREEYSRYYHVLETLITYRYPSAIGHGKVPAKQGDERFASELFTRDKRAMAARLSRIIIEVLRRGWLCAWSYADTGHASIPLVLETVLQSVTCEARSFAAPFRHTSQRGIPHKQVTEYLLLFEPCR